MNTADLDFRQLTRDEFTTLIDWARAEGWDPGINDAGIFYTAFPDSFYGYFAGDELIGGGSLVSYNGDYGFMGFFIIRPEYRSSGIGRALWFRRRDTLRGRLKPGAAIGMDGVTAMQEFYGRGGFRLAHRDERRMRLGADLPYSDEVSFALPGDIEVLLAYDRDCFGCDRRRFLELWLFDDAARSFLSRDQGRVTGYAVLRRTGSGFKIGPLFADSPAVARDLYRACLSAAPGDQVFLDIPMRNDAAVALAEEFGAAYIFECGRMYHGPEPEHCRDKVFGVTTFELG